MIELWTRHDSRLSTSRGSEELRAILEKEIPPGYGVEGEWIRKTHSFYIFDILYVPEGIVSGGTQFQKLVYKMPPEPAWGAFEIVQYNPNEWRMEAKADGDHVVALRHPEKGVSVSTFHLSNQMRFNLIQNYSKTVRRIPSADSNFEEFYKLAKGQKEEGVVMKYRTSLYEFGKKTRNWVKRRFSSDLE